MRAAGRKREFAAGREFELFTLLAGLLAAVASANRDWSNQARQRRAGGPRGTRSQLEPATGLHFHFSTP